MQTLNAASTAPEVLFVSRSAERRFSRWVRTVCATALDEVRPALDSVEAAVAGGLYAAGFVAYEAGPAFDAALRTQPSDGLPLVWFALFEDMDLHEVSGADPADYTVGAWTPRVSQDAYLGALDRIREWIASGDTYQVNYTFPMTAPFSGDTRAWFRALCAAQRSDYAAYIHAGDFAILSASPELFFRLDGERLVTRPMKGTRPRGRWLEEDRRLAAELADSEKDRAENVMIVDLLRNDMGMVSRSGSVRVPRLFDVERYETVWQMTSTIESVTEASVPAIFGALFPSGSVTGAPKVRTLQILRELEPYPRGVYCGAVGWWAPKRQAEFNVAIRTVTLDTETGLAHYNVGGGITWGSDAAAEYDECLAKAAVLTHAAPEFELLESLLFEDGDYLLLEEHLARLASSAEYFGYAVDVAEARDALARLAESFGEAPQKVRLLADRRGRFRVEHAPAPESRRVRIGFARQPVDSGNRFLFHKTTYRQVYDAAKASRSDCDDVVLWNSRGEITETATANVALLIGGEWLTPPIEAGLLDGTMRRHLLSTGKLREATLVKEDIARADAVALVNSVRKWVDAEWVP